MLARGKVFVSLEELYELFNLPKDVEIISIKPYEYGDGGIELRILSVEPISGFTIKTEYGNESIRRTRLKHDEESVKMVIDSFRTLKTKGSRLL